MSEDRIKEIDARIEFLGAEISANEEENYQMENEIEALEEELKQLKGK